MPDPRIFPIPSVNDTYAMVTGGASTLVLAANVNRVDCDFVNNGAQVCFLARGNADTLDISVVILRHIGVHK